MMVKVARYSWPDAGADFELHAARYRLLHFLDEERPEAREELKGAVRAAYRSMFDVLEASPGGAPVSRKVPNWADVYESDHFLHWLDPPEPEFEEAVDPFLSALKSWIEEYHLTAPWLGDAAIRTIRALESDLDWNRKPAWVIRNCEIPHGLTWGELEFQFSHQFWLGPSARTVDNMKNEIWKEFDKTFNTWIKNLDETLAQRGYQKNPRWNNADRDIRYLVRFQCVGESYSEIAKSEKKSNDTVRKAVKKTADFLGIKRRPTPSGRQPKKKPA
jgi:hypothetical protein